MSERSLSANNSLCFLAPQDNFHQKSHKQITERLRADLDNLMERKQQLSVSLAEFNKREDDLSSDEEAACSFLEDRLDELRDLCSIQANTLNSITKIVSEGEKTMDQSQLNASYRSDRQRISSVMQVERSITPRFLNSHLFTFHF